LRRAGSTQDTGEELVRSFARRSFARHSFARRSFARRSSIFDLRSSSFDHRASIIELRSSSFDRRASIADHQIADRQIATLRHRNLRSAPRIGDRDFAMSRDLSLLLSPLSSLFSPLFRSPRSQIERTVENLIFDKDKSHQTNKI